MLATLDGSSAAAASSISQHVVDRRANSVRAVDSSDPSLIAPVAASLARI